MKMITTAAAAAMLVMSGPAIAQTTPRDTDGTVITTEPVDDDDDFPWGLLGLLGLAGLIPRKHKDHVHVDATTRR